MSFTEVEKAPIPLRRFAVHHVPPAASLIGSAARQVGLAWLRGEHDRDALLANLLRRALAVPARSWEARQ